MMLSRLVLQPLSPDVALAVRDVHRMHRLVMSAFPASSGAGARARHAVLHRLEVDPSAGALVLYVQSESPPDWAGLPVGALASLHERANPEVRPLSELDAVRTGHVLRFRLRANPTRRIETKSVDGRRRHGRRVPHRDDARCLEWLVRQGRNHGFEIAHSAPERPEVVLAREPVQRGQRGRRTLTFEGARFDGLLRVSDEDRFRAGVRGGIGPGKAYGFGLLSVCPI